MRKPNVQNVNQLLKGYETLAIGGHECVIVKAEQRIAKSGNPMLVVDLDTAPTDKQPNFYKKRFEADTRPDKKWGCTLYFTQDGSEFNQGRIALFICAVCNANGMDYDNLSDNDWEIIDRIIQGKKVCVVFREEEYEKEDGSVGVSIKPYSFRLIEDFKEGKIKPPKKKVLKNNNDNNNIFGGDITPVDDGEMPF